jgi:hypothetical protein
MSERLDLLKIAQEEQSGDLFKLLDSIYKRSKIQPRGISDAIIWEGGNWTGNVKPVVHASERHDHGSRRIGPAIPRSADDGAVPS